MAHPSDSVKASESPTECSRGGLGPLENDSLLLGRLLFTPYNNGDDSPRRAKIQPNTREQSGQASDRPTRNWGYS